MERVLLTTGGTGGHIFPALAVAEEIRSRYPGVRILFVGGLRGLEKELAGKAGLEFEGLPIKPFIGRGIRAVFALYWLLVSLLKALRLLGKFKPDMVLGLGGYAAFAPMFAARLRGVPTAVHEQNSIPGVTNRIMGKLARKVLVSFPDSVRYFDERKSLLTGNPVRASFQALRAQLRKSGSEDAQFSGKRLLVIGGSQGAKSVNTAIMNALPELQAAGVSIRHQTGQLDYQRVLAGYEERGVASDQVSAFIDDMAEAYANADLIVCRAGATSIAELTVAGKPALFIPFPYATHNHQVGNARFMERMGAALCVEEKELPEKDLAKLILELLQDTSRLASMARAADSLGRPDAAAAVVDELEKLAAGGRNRSGAGHEGR